MRKIIPINTRPLVDIEEEELLQLLKSKDIKDSKLAQEEFFFRYRSYIYTVCLDRAKHYKKSADLAEDISQETFIKAFDKLPLFDLSKVKNNNETKRNIKKWLATTIKREFVNFFRKNPDEFKLSLLITEDNGLDVSDEHVEQSPPSIHLSLLLDALQELTGRERHILMTYFDYYDWQNPRKHLPDDVIAMLCETHNTNPDNIKHIKLRAIKKLQKKLVK